MAALVHEKRGFNLISGSYEDIFMKEDRWHAKFSPTQCLPGEGVVGYTKLLPPLNNEIQHSFMACSARKRCTYCFLIVLC